VPYISYILVINLPSYELSICSMYFLHTYNREKSYTLIFLGFCTKFTRMHVFGFSVPPDLAPGGGQAYHIEEMADMA